MRALEWLSRLEISTHVNVRFLFKSCSFVDACIKEDVTSLYTNIPQEEGITTVCKTYEAFYNRNILYLQIR